MSIHPIEVRNLRFPLHGVPKHWLGGKRALSTFFDNLSVLFPQGERFFLNSVRAHEPLLRDAALREDVKGFYQQEALHSREHVRYNDMLRAHGYPVDEMEQNLARLLAVVSKLPPHIQLAVTCSLEHFTAMLAQFVLAEGSGFEYAHPTMAALWRWHAAEENEHASVAFDVFKAIGGIYPQRVIVMLFATLIFWAKVIEQQLRMMRADGTLGSLDEWSALGHALFVQPGYLRRLVRPYLAYFKPGFHPSELDCSALLARWQAEFASLPVYRESQSPARAN